MEDLVLKAQRGGGVVALRSEVGFYRRALPFALLCDHLMRRKGFRDLRKRDEKPPNFFVCLFFTSVR